MVANGRDLLAGLFFIAVGAVVMVMAQDYGRGTLAHVGPGFFPMVLAAAMMLLGAAIALLAVKDRVAAPLLVVWRPLAVITLAVALFALALDTLGLFLAVAILVGVSRLARRGEAWVETLLLSLVGAGVAVGLFGYLLALPVRLWPSFAM
ncbi:MAG: tripartite tricarboxylate transporter TctB family protein [Pseudomonadota bacterium]